MELGRLASWAQIMHTNVSDTVFEDHGKAERIISSGQHPVLSSPP
jgi:hypothetical protein